MLSTAILAFLGFFFWIVNARLYTPEQVGLATTLLSVVGLISNVCLLGFNNGLIRYLPTSEHKNDMINTTLVLVGFASLILGILYTVFIDVFSPKLSFIRNDLGLYFIFLIFVVLSSFSALSENIFIAFRNSKYILIRNTLLSIIKLIFPLFLVALGAYGIFLSVGIATAVSFVVSIVYLVKKFDYKIKFIVNKILVRRMFKFSLANYIAGLIGGLPQTILPILITNHLGPSYTAFYYMPMMIASLLFIIPQGITKSLFAEGSTNEKELSKMYRKSLKLNVAIYLPAMIISLLLGQYVLLAFGPEYAKEGTTFLQLLAVSGIFVSINSIIGTILNIRHKLKEIIFINVFTVVIILGLSYVLTSMYLLGIGIAWIIGQIVMSVIYFIVYMRLKSKSK